MRKKSANITKMFVNDDINALDARYEAQKLAFAPIVFQATRTLLSTGILDEIGHAGEIGISYPELGEKLKLKSYTLKVLMEMGLSANLIKVTTNSENSENSLVVTDQTKFILAKTGYFLLHDPMTQVNLNFTNDVCYKGSFDLDLAIKNEKPEGLKVFGEWNTIYEGLSQLEPDVQKSWFDFDHHYSDAAFPDALKYVFSFNPHKILDIGGNTGKWAFACTKHNSEVNMTIVDLPGQAAMVRKHIEKAELKHRIEVYESDMLDSSSTLPSGHDAVWMSQFLDCFSLDEISAILLKIHNAVDENASVFVMEPLWDKQKFPAAVYSLHATSLYFTAMANGNSKMYSYQELVDAIEKSGFKIVNENHDIGPKDYSILRFKKASD